MRKNIFVGSRVKFREDAVTSQYLRQLSVALFAGGIIGLAFSPTPEAHIVFATIPIGLGAMFGLLVLIEDTEN